MPVVLIDYWPELVFAILCSKYPDKVWESFGVHAPLFQWTCTCLFGIRRCMVIRTVILWHDEMRWSPVITRELGNNCLTDYVLATMYGAGIFVIIDWVNGMLPNRYQGITWINADLWSVTLSTFPPKKNIPNTSYAFFSGPVRRIYI